MLPERMASIRQASPNLAPANFTPESSSELVTRLTIP